MNATLMHYPETRTYHALETSWSGLLLQAAFLRRCKTMRVHFMAYVAPEGTNKTVWGAKLILMADLVYHSTCASLDHLLMAQYCHFYLNVCFSLPMAPHPFPPPTPPPSHPSTSYRLNPHYYSRPKKLPQKPRAFK